MTAPKSPRRWTLAQSIAALQKLYGRPPRPAVTDPFEMILWENCAYLVDDARRREVFRSLRDRVGLSPQAILRAPDALLLASIEGSGMRPADRAERLRDCAAIAEEIGIAQLRNVVRTDPVAARKILRKFPGIADPGAEKILLYNRGWVTLAPDSNILRVLVRLGFGRKEKDYSRTYRSAAEAVAGELPAGFDALVRARELLRRHGQELCRRNHPLCEACPLSAKCAAFRANSFAFF